MLVKLYKIGGVHFRLLGTNGFHVKAKNESFTPVSLRWRQNLRYKFSRRRLVDYVKKKKKNQKACRTCSTIIFLHSTNQIFDLWRCRWRCRRQILNTLLVSLKSTTRRERQCHKCCLFSEQKPKPCTPFTCFYFCTFLSRYRQICHVKWPFPSFEFSFLALIPHLLIQFLGNSAGFKSETNWHNEDWKQSLCISSQTSESLSTSATITSQICILTFHLYENEDFPTFEDSVCVLSWELV